MPPTRARARLPLLTSLIGLIAVLLAAELLLPAAAGAPEAVPEAERSDAPERIDRLIRFNNLASAHLARFRENEAIEELKKALELDPGYAVAHLNLGIAYLSLADYAAAEVALRRGLALRPDEPCGLFNLGLVFKVQGKTAEAIEAFEGVRLRDPDDPDTLYQLGTLYARERQLERAIEVFRRSIEMGPNNVSAYYGLGKALVQTGEMEDGRRYLEISQEMKADGLATTVGTRYGEQGKYSYAMEDDRVRQLARLPAPAAIPVRFVPVPADESGIRLAPGSKPAGAPGCDDGSGAALSDIDGDDDLDLYLPICRPGDGAAGRLYRNEGGFRFTDVTAAAGVEGVPGGLAAAFGDYDNDRQPDLFLTGRAGRRLYRNLGAGRFEEVTAAAGIAPEGGASGAAWVDIDHDGDLDLFARGFPAGTSTTNLLYRNQGDGTFAETAGSMGLAAGRGAGLSLVFSDFDNDRDIDLVLPGIEGAWQLLSNDRVGTFTDVATARGLTGPPAHAVAAADFDKDGFIDLAATGPEGLAVLRNLAGGAFRRDAEAGEVAASRRRSARSLYGLAFLDFDNDGYLDLAAAPGDKGGPAAILLRNVGDGRFEDWTAKAGLAKVKSRRGRALVAGDLDADGDVDLLVTHVGSEPLLLRNDGGSGRASLIVDVTGKSSNRSAVGSKVEIKAGRGWQKLEVISASGYLSGGPMRLHFGLGDATRVDTLRVLWPSGVLQDEIDVARAPVVEVEELDRKGSSCPILYAWDGTRFGFVTDFLGGSAVGYRVGAAAFNTPDTDEYVKVRGDQLRPRDGRLELRMVNQLEEVIFIDRAQLLAVDHPRDVSVYPNERLLPAPPFPAHEIFTVREARRPVSAVDGEGRDVRDRILREDRRWPDDFRPLPFKGYAEPHALVLDPGDLRGAGRVVLLADAWIDYADSTSNLAASQSGAPLIPPRLEVLGPDGEWVVALPQMGFPAGLPKTLTVELTGLFRRDDDFRVRIVTSMRIYWDRVRFGILHDEPELQVTPLEPVTAELRFKGYPRPVAPDGRAPFGYDYGDAAVNAGWKDFEGAFTRFGDVRGLLLGVDDRFVIQRHGDEIAVAFDAAQLPPLPAGWTRDYLVYADGFGKDMDLNSAQPHRVEPLPFHAMSGYPPAEGERGPVDASHLNWARQMNTRRVHRQLPELH